MKAKELRYLSIEFYAFLVEHFSYAIRSQAVPKHFEDSLRMISGSFDLKKRSQTPEMGSYQNTSMAVGQVRGDRE